MTAEHVVTLVLRSSDGVVSGTAQIGRGEPVAFNGWIGMIGTLADATAASDAGTAARHPSADDERRDAIR